MELVMADMTVQERYKYLTAVVVPRPVALVTTRDARGIHNSAPFSLFNVFSDDPPLVILGLAPRPDGRTKDSFRNIEEVGEFVISMVDTRIVEAMHVGSADVPYGTDEIDFTDVSLVPGRVGSVKRIAEAPVNMECTLHSVIELPNHRHLVFGQVTCIHIRDEIVEQDTGRIIPEQYSPIARLYGHHYAWLGERYVREIPTYEDIAGSPSLPPSSVSG